MKSEIGPFTLSPVLLPKPWGGELLEPWLGLEPSGRSIGEAWLCSDLDVTAVSGAGGGAFISLIDQGWGAGRTIREVIQESGVELLGGECSRLPLLMKLLDASRHLSVQVHPSEHYASRFPDAHVKSEAWYALDLRPSALFMVGLKDVGAGASLQQVARAGEIESHLCQRVVGAGDAVFIPSGTVHALGAGSTVFEVQTASDTTFRLYDWSRQTSSPGRELHIEEAILASDLGLEAQWSIAEERRGSACVFSTSAFSLYSLEHGAHRLDRLKEAVLPLRGVFLLPLQVGCAVSWRSQVYDLPKGRVSLFPASLLEGARVIVNQGSTVLAITIG